MTDNFRVQHSKLTTISTGNALKILFLCGGLEPGRDGVGDYTRRLAGELIRQGNEAAIIALMDPHMTEIFTGVQCSEGFNIPVLRIPLKSLSKNRFSKIKEWIKEYNPIWLSLQYVPFAFQSKGLPATLGKSLQKLGKGRKWHVMFHELWVGIETDADWKHIGWGFVQRIIVKKLLRKLQPLVVHTQTRTYQLLLQKLGIDVDYLPLFSNIPPFPLNTKNRMTVAEKQKRLSFIVFGAVYPDAPVEEFVKEVSEYQKTKGLFKSITFIGRCGSEIQRWVDACKNVGINIKLLGEQSAQVISEELFEATIGISTTPLALAEKSGTVAAMIAHGLRVICVRNPWQARGIRKIEDNFGLIEYKQGNFDFCMSVTSFAPIYNVNEIALQMAELLRSSISFNQ